MSIFVRAGRKVPPLYSSMARSQHPASWTGKAAALSSSVHYSDSSPRHLYLPGVATAAGVLLSLALALWRGFPAGELPSLLCGPLLVYCGMLSFRGPISCRNPRRPAALSVGAPALVSVLCILRILFPALAGMLRVALPVLVCTGVAVQALVLCRMLSRWGYFDAPVPPGDFRLLVESCLEAVAVLSTQVLALAGRGGGVAALLLSAVGSVVLALRVRLGDAHLSKVCPGCPVTASRFGRNYLPAAVEGGGVLPSYTVLFAECLRYMDAHREEVYSQYFLVSHLVRGLGTSAKTLGRATRAVWGGTPGDVISAYRVQHAVDIWGGGGDLPVGRMSEECGYRNVGRFKEDFRRITGMGVQEWLLRNRGTPVEASSPKGEGRGHAG